MTKAAAILDKASHLLDDPDPDQRLKALHQVTEQYCKNMLSSAEKKLAEQIFRVLMHDAETNIRKALSENIKDTDTVPKDIVMQLVDDVDEVAVPVIQYSDVLTDADLMEIIKNSGSTEKLMAISNRKVVNEKVSEALVDTGEEKVVKNLLQRAVAKISSMTMDKVVEKFPDNEEVMTSLSHRESLPASIVEKIIKKVGGALQKELVQKYGHVMPNISEIVEKSQEAATLRSMGMKSSDSEIKTMVDAMEKTGEIAQDIFESGAEVTKTLEHLQASGRLTPISALCMGNLELYEICLARVINVPVANIKKLVDDDSGEGFKALYKRAKLPENLFDAATLVVKVVKQMDREAKDNKSIKKTANAIIARLLAASEEQKNEVPNLSYLISLIHKHAKVGQ